VRHRDPETGFVHHGFLNVLVAAADAAEGTDVAGLTETLASTDAPDLTARARRALGRPRPLFTGFGSCSVEEPLNDLLELDLLHRGSDA
jgi:hypothetical protein